MKVCRWERGGGWGKMAESGKSLKCFIFWSLFLGFVEWPSFDYVFTFYKAIVLSSTRSRRCWFRVIEFLKSRKSTAISWRRWRRIICSKEFLSSQRWHHSRSPGGWRRGSRVGNSSREEIDWRRLLTVSTRIITTSIVLRRFRRGGSVTFVTLTFLNSERREWKEAPRCCWRRHTDRLFQWKSWGTGFIHCTWSKQITISKCLHYDITSDIC